MNIQRLLGVKPFKESKSIICVQPHPDDNEVGMGGTVKTLSALGCRITFVTVTDGRYGTSDPNLEPEELVRIRHKEKCDAGKMIGVTTHYDLGFEDGGDYSERAVMTSLLPIFRKEKPEMVVTVDPWTPYEAHPDHYKVGRAVAAAVLRSGNISFPEAGDPVNIPQVAFYGTSYPNTFVDVTPFWETKMQSILAHQSQFANDEWPLLSQFFTYQAMTLWQQSNAGKAQQSTGMAEAFKMLSTKQLHFFPDAVRS